MMAGFVGRRFACAPFIALPLWWRFSRHGGPFGGPRRGGFGGWGFSGPRRRFERGDLKYVILDLLQDGPRHGYDIIRALEERFHGFYSPSAGSVYPTLQLLEDQGYVTSSQQDGKRVYTITESGRAFLKERADTMDDVRARMASGWGGKVTPELRGLMDEVRQLGQLIFAEGAHGGLNDPETVRRLRDLVRRVRGEVEAIFRTENDTPTTV
jgi:DNA-binding PadR family transcriptional regulator